MESNFIKSTGENINFKEIIFLKHLDKESEFMLIKELLGYENYEIILDSLLKEGLLRQELIIPFITDKGRKVLKDLKFTEEDLDSCWIYYKSYLIDILNKNYLLEDAIEDLKSLIGTKFDKRI